MKINWTVRIKNKDFWLALIPAALVLIELIAKLFGLELDLGEVGNTLKEIVNVIFIILSILGIVIDPTTKGLSDSARAMTYTEPHDDGEAVG